MKIRLRLTLWYFSVTLAILLIFSLGTYWAMKTLLFRALDQELNIVSETILRSYDPFLNEFDELSFSPKTSIAILNTTWLFITPAPNRCTPLPLRA